MEFPPGSFELIYSLGMFGNGCPVTVDICNRFHRWLAPGGKLFFNTIDLGGLPLWYRARRQARDIAYPLLTRSCRKRLDERQARLPFCALSKRELRRILTESEFSVFELQSSACESPLWQGRHLECLAVKS
jgi:hypothetical protein